MMQQSDPRRQHCHSHSEPVVVFDLTVQQKEKQGLWLKCLTFSRNKLIILEEAQSQIKFAKQEVKKRKIAENDHHIQVLSYVIQKLVDLKNSFELTFNKLTSSLEQWIGNLRQDSESYDEQLETLEANYLSQFTIQLHTLSEQNNTINNKYKKIIANQLEQIEQQDQILSISKTINLIEDNIKNYVQEDKYELVEQPKNENFQRLNFQCEKHKSDITHLDLTEDCSSESRMGCVRCVYENSDKKYTPLTLVQDKWKLYLEEKSNQLSVLKKQYISQLDQLRGLYQSIKSYCVKEIDQTQVFINEKKIIITSSIEQEFSNQNNNWHSLSKDEIISIAEKLSSTGSKEIEIKLKQLENETNQFVNDSILSLISTQFNFYEGIYKKIILDGNNTTALQRQRLNVIIASIQSASKVIEQATQTEIQEFISTAVGEYCLVNHILQSTSNIINIRVNGPANYQMVQQHSLQQSEYCLAIAFNKDQTIMAAGCQKQIKVFEFHFGQLKLIEILNDHTDNIFTLCFMKQSNQFISAGRDNSIRIWEGNNNHFFCKQAIKQGHQSHVNQVILNNNEDMFISCSNDKSIKFWSKKNEWDCMQTITSHKSYVNSISLNKSQNSLVSCGEDKLILIIKSNSNNKWEVTQNIKVESLRVRVSFIGDNLIALQQFNGIILEIFKLKEQSKQFLKQSEVKIEKSNGCSYYFPQIFNSQKAILLSKNGNRINLLRKKHNDELCIEQSIKFGHYQIWGARNKNRKQYNALPA